MNIQANRAAQTAMQESATQIAQNKCSIKINSILQQLKSDGLQHITDVFIQEWCLPLPPKPRDAAKDLVQRLALLYTLLENWKVSITITYNPLMTAMGYTYQGHDFGWKAQDPINNTWSSMPSTPLQLSSDANDAKRTSDLYKVLLGHTASLHVTTTEFR
jgi:hypothetical protein